MVRSNDLYEILVDLSEILTGFPIPKDTFSGIWGGRPQAPVIKGPPLLYAYLQWPMINKTGSNDVPRYRLAKLKILAIY